MFTKYINIVVFSMGIQFTHNLKIILYPYYYCMAVMYIVCFLATVAYTNVTVHIVRHITTINPLITSYDPLQIRC